MMDIFIQTDRENDSLYLGLSKAALERGSVKTSVRVGEDIVLDFDESERLIGIDVMNATKNLGNEFDDIRIDSLIGVKEAAEELGVQRSNFIRDWANRPDFPAPVSTTAAGRIWLRSQVVEYYAKQAVRNRDSHSTRGSGPRGRGSR